MTPMMLETKNVNPAPTMKKLLTLATTFCLATALNAFAVDESSIEIENTSVVPSGTYQVTALRVDPKQKEIYVKTKDGKTLELYFKDDTKLTKDGEPVGFEALKKDQPLQVKVEKSGDHLKPLEVSILTQKTTE